MLKDLAEGDPIVLRALGVTLASAELFALGVDPGAVVLGGRF